MSSRPGGRHCDAARASVSLELDAALDDVGRLLRRRHLARCAECARFAAELAAITTMLREQPLEPFRCELDRRAYARRRPVRWAGSAAAVAALVLGIVSLPYAAPSSRAASLTTADLAGSSVPVKLPIGQRSAEDDFVVEAPAVVA